MQKPTPFTSTKEEATAEAGAVGEVGAMDGAGGGDMAAAEVILSLLRRERVIKEEAAGEVTAVATEAVGEAGASATC